MLKSIGMLTGIALSGLILAGCDASNSENKMTEITYHNMPGTEDLGLPFSSAVQVDNTLYMSGNLGNLPGKLETNPQLFNPKSSSAGHSGP